MAINRNSSRAKRLLASWKLVVGATRPKRADYISIHWLSSQSLRRNGSTKGAEEWQNDFKVELEGG